MSYENNKQNFEGALEEMKETVSLLNQCVDDYLMETLKTVINEYEIHFKSDIEEMADLVREQAEIITEYAEAQPPI